LKRCGKKRRTKNREEAEATTMRKRFLRSGEEERRRHVGKAGSLSKRRVPE